MQLIQFNVPLLPVVLVTSFLLGIPAVTSSAAVQTLLQERVPDAYRGRVFGSLSTMVALICLVSVLGFGGALASVIGIVPVLTPVRPDHGLGGSVRSAHPGRIDPRRSGRD